MSLLRYARALETSIRPPLPVFRFLNRRKDRFECPVCGYIGPFMDVTPASGLRKHAKCPKCGSLERHRLQYLVMMNLLKSREGSRMKMLHVAPEAFFRSIFSEHFGEYETADLSMEAVDHQVDLRHLPFDDESYDLVFASHVLEHVSDDRKAIGEIRRILKPHGIAVLPVPLVCEKTVEYPEPNPTEDYHVRAPGIDYFERYELYFSMTERIASDSFPDKYQLFVYEDRSMWPTDECPFRPPMPGTKHIDIVPVCYV
jgi:SAM-dependent methyltransferase